MTALQFFRGLGEVPPDFGPSAVAIGKFDGVHLGHRAVVGRLAREAAVRNLVPTVLTFDRNPLALLDPERCPRPLLDSSERASLLGEAGADAVIEVVFDREFSALPAERFVDEVLVGIAGARLVLAGRDLRFGAGGRGDLARLEQLAGARGLEVLMVDDVVAADGVRASSTRIRALLDAGDPAAAAALLGRLPRVRGPIVHGEQRGRTLGYRTANLSSEYRGHLPRDGVYAAWVSVDGGVSADGRADAGTRHGAAVSIGDNPTFVGGAPHQLEAHLLDAELDLYGREVTVEFVDYLRPMHRFASADALVEQMHLDETSIRSTLGYPPAASTLGVSSQPSETVEPGGSAQMGGSAQPGESA